MRTATGQFIMLIQQQKKLPKKGELWKLDKPWIRSYAPKRLNNDLYETMIDNTDVVICCLQCGTCCYDTEGRQNVSDKICSRPDDDYECDVSCRGLPNKWTLNANGRARCGVQMPAMNRCSSCCDDV
ncbi:hypothetical protein ABVT39_025103, partial [Epinephelus coioides]